MGGFCVGLISGTAEAVGSDDFGCLDRAAIYGSVAASFAIEQVGMPKLSYRDEDGKEMWNGDLVSERLQKMLDIYSGFPFTKLVV